MTIQYTDVSHYQSGLSLKGTPAACAKASQGTGYVDTAYVGFKNQAASLGIPFSAYHWLDTADAAAQAAHAFAVVGRGVPLMIDDEQGVINVPHTVAFIQAYRKLGGLVNREYAPPWVWRNSGQPDLRPIANLGFTFVSSYYVAGYGDGGPGWASYGGITPSEWQWTSKAAFNGQKVDMNAFRGTVDQLKQLWGLAPSPSRGGLDMPAIVRVTENGGIYSITGADQQYHWFRSTGAVTAALAGYRMTQADIQQVATKQDLINIYGVDVDKPSGVQGPKGDPGDPGEPGKQGPPGPALAPGTVFTGTVAG